MTTESKAGEALDLNKTRAEFEAWHRSKFATKHSTGQPTRDMHNGAYAEKYGPEKQQLMWEAWQAALARSSLSANAGRREGQTPQVDALMERWGDDGASRGAAFCELRDLAREMEIMLGEMGEPVGAAPAATAEPSDEQCDKAEGPSAYLCRMRMANGNWTDWAVSTVHAYEKAMASPYSGIEIKPVFDAAPLPTKEGAGEVDAWIRVEDRLPEQECLAVYVTPNGKQRLIRAKYARQFQIEAEGDDCEAEYNEDDDTFYIKAGWLECIDNWGEYSSCYVVEGTVTHWKSSPALPAIAAQPKDTTDTLRGSEQ